MTRFWFSVFLMLAIPVAVMAQTEAGTVKNSGFAPGNLWFSKTPPVSGETIKIYTLLWNASADDISGEVSFFDNDKVLGKQEFVLSGGGSFKVLSVPWTVTDGYHKIYAQVTESIGGPRGKTATAITLEYSRTDEEEQFVSPPPSPKTSATTTAKNFLSEKVELVKEYIEANSPEAVKSISKSVASTTNSLRESAKSWSEEKVSVLKNELEKEKSGTGEKDVEWFGAKRPLQYAGLFLLSVSTYVFDRPVIFYGLLVILVFFVLRFIKRKFFFG